MHYNDIQDITWNWNQ